MSESVQSGGAAAGGQKLFCNVFTHNLDAKRRLTIPSDWRELVGQPQKIFVLQGLDVTPHLRALPAYEMARRLEKLQGVSLSDTAAQEHIRTLTSRSDLVPWDAQGRIRIKEDLLASVGLKGEVMLVGAMDHFELWSTEKWKQRSSVSTAELAAATRAVGF